MLAEARITTSPNDVSGARRAMYARLRSCALGLLLTGSILTIGSSHAVVGTCRPRGHPRHDRAVRAGRGPPDDRGDGGHVLRGRRARDGPGPRDLGGADGDSGATER